MAESILHMLGTFLFQHLGLIDVHDVIILLLLPQDDIPQVFYILVSISPPGLNQLFHFHESLPKISATINQRDKHTDRYELFISLNSIGLAHNIFLNDYCFLNNVFLFVVSNSIFCCFSG